LGHLRNIFSRAEQGYYLFTSTALFLASFFLLYHALRNFWFMAVDLSRPLDLPLLMESVIMITLSVAIFDLAKATVEEELVRGTDYLKHSEIRRGLTRFLTAVTVAASIEVLMLIFKFSLDKPENLLYAALLMFGLALLISSLGLYSMLSVRAESKKDRME